MNVTLRKIGNSVGVIIPKEMLDRFGLKEGDELSLEASEGAMVLKPSDDRLRAPDRDRPKFMDKYKIALQKLAE